MTTTQKKIDPTKLTDEEIRKLIKELREKAYKTDPVQWASDVLGFEYNSFVWSEVPGFPEDHKWDSALVEYDPVTGEYNETPLKDPLAYVMRQVAAGNKRIGVESANATGKSVMAVALAYYFFDQYENSRVVTAAPKEQQLKKTIWYNMKKYWKGFSNRWPEAIRGVLNVDAEREIETHRAVRRDVREIVGYTAGVGAGEEAATKAQGFHEEHMLFLFDEGPGLDPAFITAFVNTATGSHNIILMTGNPDGREDQLHQFCKLSTTIHVRISALDHPNVVMGREVFPGAVTQESIDEKFERYGSDPQAPMYLSRVRGMCPAGSIHGLFSQTAIAKAEKMVMEKTDPDSIITIDHKSATSEGWTKIFYPVAKTHYARYIIFCDIASDDLTGDWHAAIFFDRIDQRPVAIVHMRGLREDFAQEVTRLAKTYAVQLKDNELYYPMLAWETNGVGSLSLIDCIKNYPNPFHNRNVAVENPSIYASLGWNTNKTTRPEMMHNLRFWGSELVFAPHRMVSEDLLAEARSFVANTRKKGMGRFEAAKGRNDDMIMALSGALSVHKMYDDHPPVPIEIKEPPKVNEEREAFLREQRKLAGVSVPSGGGNSALRNSRWTQRPSGIITQR